MPTIRELRRIEGPDRATYAAHFGSWRQALAELGMEARTSRQHGSAELLQVLRDLARELGRTGQRTRTARLVVRKMHIPPLVVKKIIKHVVRVAKTSEFSENSEVCLEQPDVRPETVLVGKVYTPEVQPGRRSVLTQVCEERASYEVVGPDVYSAGTELAAVYRLDVWTEPSPPSTATGAGSERPALDDTSRRDGP